MTINMNEKCSTNENSNHNMIQKHTYMKKTYNIKFGERKMAYEQEWSLLQLAFLLLVFRTVMLHIAATAGIWKLNFRKQ